MQNDIGVIIERGAEDWQIFQQDAKGTATIRLSGRWLTEDPYTSAKVVVRLVREDCGEPVVLAHDWTRARTTKDGRWSVTLSGVPAGGLYRLETGLQLSGAAIEWSQRGDMVHHLGVGDVWVIAGQSNSAGYGKAPVVDSPELGVHMFHARGAWQLAAHPLSDSTGSRYAANREHANGSHSPYLAFARFLRRRLGYPIGLIPAALGGSPISAWAPSLDGTLFRNAQAYVRDAGGACRGVLWYQGESDTGEGDREAYLGRFRELVAGFREVFRTPLLPVITAQLNRYIGDTVRSQPPDGWDVIREAQRQAARQIDGVFVISTLDLALSDGIHIRSDSNLTIGERMAAVALGAVHGRDVKHLHPDLDEARRLSDSKLELVFANVDTRLHYENNHLDELPFAVRDESGPVPVEGWHIVKRNCLRLVLARPLQGTATIIGAPTALPPSIVPIDICGYRPMLGFTVTV